MTKPTCGVIGIGRRKISYLIPAGLCVLPLLFACSRTEPSDTADEPIKEIPIGFTDVASEVGLGEFRHVSGAFGEKWFPETMGAGGGFLDYDGDGHLDILLVAGTTFASREEPAGPALRLYRNDGAARFTEVTESTGLGGIEAYAFGVTIADYDNDDDADIFVTALFENLLLRNDEGVFRDVAADAGVRGATQWSAAAVFFDADRDGHLDLFVGNYVKWSPETDVFCTRVGDRKSYCTPELYEGISGRFYQNRGEGTFTDRSQELGFTEAPGKTLGAIAMDFNRDGWPDLVVANDTQRDLLYENRGDGTFTEKGVFSGIAFDENGRARAGMGVDAGIVDESGEVTIVIGHFSQEMVGVYRHQQSGFFTDRAAVSRIGRPSLRTLTFGLFLFDVDLDADLDLFTANGHITEDIELVEDGITFRQPAQLYRNQGDGFFEPVPESATPPLAVPMVARGAASGDFDNDGDLDILVTENSGPVHLWRNDLAGGNWLRVHLEGTNSNRDGIGARVVVYVDQRTQERYVRAGGSYLSHSETAPLFGLGAADRIDSLTVYWPSGAVDRLGAFSSGSDVRIVEGASGEL